MSEAGKRLSIQFGDITEDEADAIIAKYTGPDAADARHELIGQACAEAAASLVAIVEMIKAWGYDPKRIGIEPCGMEAEVDLEEICGDLLEVTSYLPANGWLYRLPANGKAA